MELERLGCGLIGKGPVVSACVLVGAPTEPGGSVNRLAVAGSGVNRFNMRTLPVWLSVRTGSASAINCSIFLMGSVVRGGAFCPGTDRDTVVEAIRVGGRRTTPCMAGSVRVPACTGIGLGGCGTIAGVGLTTTGTGLMAGGVAV